MNEHKLKWKMAEPPSGRFKSFHKRGWPSATMVGSDHPMVSIDCEDSYTPAIAKDGSHRELTVRIADWTKPTDSTQARWKWRTLKARFTSLEDAKAAAKKFLDTTPEFWPTEDAR
jgi:hypothetical protein